MSCQECVARMRIENHGNVVVTRRPRITQQVGCHSFKLRRSIVTQELERGSQRLAPLLIPARLTTSLTTTISRPTPDTMRATPRRAFTLGSVIDLHRQLWPMMIEILRIVRDPKTRRLCITNYAQYLDHHRPELTVE